MPLFMSTFWFPLLEDRTEIAERKRGMAFVLSLLGQLFGRNPFDATALSDLSGIFSSGDSNNNNDDDLPARPQRSARKPSPISTARSPNNFVDLLVQVVTRDIVHRRVEERIRTFQTRLDSTQKSHDALDVFSKNLTKRKVPEVQSILDELHERIEQQRVFLESEWRDEYGRVYTCGLRDLLTAAESDQRLASRARNESMTQLLQTVDVVVDAAFDTGLVAGLPMGRSICGRLKTLCGGAKPLEESEQQLRELGNTAPLRTAVQEALQALTVARRTGASELISRETANVLRARQSFASAITLHGVSRRTLEVQRSNQRAREEDFLDKMAYPLLVQEGHLQAQESPSLPPTPSSLERFSTSGSAVDLREGVESVEQDSDNSQSDNEDRTERLMFLWRKAQQMLAQSERDYKELRYDHTSILAEHLAAFGNATLETAEREYERIKDGTFSDQGEEARSQVDTFRATYERAKAVAREAGVEDLPLSPTAYADDSRDGRTGSAGSGWYQLVLDDAPNDKRRVLRWGRMVARGRPQRSPRASPTWSISSVGSLKPVDDTLENEPSDRAMLARYKRKLDAVRSAAEKEHREGLVDLPTETRAQKRQRLGDIS